MPADQARRKSTKKVSGLSGLQTGPSIDSDKDNQQPIVQPTGKYIDITEGSSAIMQPTSIEPMSEPDAIKAVAFTTHDRDSMLRTKFNLDVKQPLWSGRPRANHDRVQKAIRMRVRYNCHRCQTSFGHDKECTSCQHRRCIRCDRNPPRRTREQVAAATIMDTTAEAPNQTEAPEEKACSCHECQTDVFIGVDQCPNCSHIICDRCYKEATLLNELQQQMAESSAETSKLIGSIAKAPPERIGSSEIGMLTHVESSFQHSARVPVPA